MAKPLLAILKTRPQTKTTELDTIKRYAPHSRETAVRTFLRKLAVQDNGYPYGNEDAFTASRLKVFDRGANRYGKDDVDYNNVKMNVLPGDSGLEEAWLRRKKRNRALEVADKAGVDDIKRTSHKEELELVESGPTRKHFREVANLVRAIEDPVKRQEYSDHHAAIFAAENPRFNHAKWHAAAGTKTKAERGIHEENLTEKLGPNASVKDYIDDFVHSKNSKFSHDDKKQRIRRALGAYYKSHPKTNEDTAADIIPHGERISRLLARAAVAGRKLPAWVKDKEEYKKGRRNIGTVYASPKRRGLREIVAIDETKQDHDRRYARWLKKRIVKGDREAVKLRKNLRGEEQELQELSRGTLGSYIQKASKDFFGDKSHHRTTGVRTAAEKLKGNWSKSKVRASDKGRSNKKGLYVAPGLWFSNGHFHEESK